MGRTVPSWRQVVEEVIARFSGFKTPLRGEDPEIFDDLMNQCRLYASAASYAALPVKSDGIFLTLLFAHHKMIHELQDKVQQLSSPQPPSKETLDAYKS